MGTEKTITVVPICKRGGKEMAIRYSVDIDKAVEVLLYVANQVSDTYNALKVIYFADKLHLGEYGRLIYGDDYVAMQHGPVPSLAYNIVRKVRGDGPSWLTLPKSPDFSVEGNDVIPNRTPDMDLLSESDIGCLNEAIERYGKMSFRQLKRVSHADEAFQAVDEKDIMSLELIAQSLPNGDELLEHLRNG